MLIGNPVGLCLPLILLLLHRRMYFYGERSMKSTTELSQSYINLAPGDPAPWFHQRSTSNPNYAFDTAAGRYIVLCFYGSAGDPLGRAAIEGVFASRQHFDDVRLSFFGVSLDPRDETEGGYARACRASGSSGIRMELSAASMAPSPKMRSRERRRSQHVDSGSYWTRHCVSCASFPSRRTAATRSLCSATSSNCLRLSGSRALKSRRR